MRTMGAFNGEIDVHACRCYADASVVVGTDCGNRIKQEREKPRQGAVANTQTSFRDGVAFIFTQSRRRRIKKTVADLPLKG